MTMDEFVTIAGIEMHAAQVPARTDRWKEQTAKEREWDKEAYHFLIHLTRKIPVNRTTRGLTIVNGVSNPNSLIEYVDYEIKSSTFFYSMGSGLGRKVNADLVLPPRPKLDDILDHVRSDCESLSMDFKEFCDSFGYDTDSRHGEYVYNQCRTIAKGIKEMLGDDLFDTFLLVEPL